MTSSASLALRKHGISVFAAVGTTPFGWRELLEVVDHTADRYGWSGTVQAGNSRWTPRTLTSVDFMPRSMLTAWMRTSDLVVVHGGLGLMGDAIRHATRLVVVPRPWERSRRSRQTHPNDQWPVAQRLGAQYGFHTCGIEELPDILPRVMAGPPSGPREPDVSDVPDLVRNTIRALLGEHG